MLFRSPLALSKLTVQSGMAFEGTFDQALAEQVLQTLGKSDLTLPAGLNGAVIKANIPSRIAFQVASGIDSRVILDTNGAERLLGKGDMLYLPPGSAKLTRAQGVLVTDEEIHRVVANLAAQSKPVFEPSISAKLSSTIMPEDEVTDEEEDLVDRCLEIIRQEKKASTSMLQRRLRLGYTRAARIVDILEQRGILGPKDGAKDREILVDLDGLDDTGNY